MTDREKQFVANLVQQLDQSIDQLDQPVQSRLDVMRAQAINSARSSKPAPGMERMARAEYEKAPPEIETRLDEIRRQAMAKAARLQLQQDLVRQKSISGWQFWSVFFKSLRSGPKVAMASAFVMVLAVSLFFVIPQPDQEIPLSDEINLLASADDIELYENLNFYLWLAENGISN